MAIGSGLALGREGPTIHIGASIGHLLAKISRCNEHESRVLLAAGAGAGLATAFNAPIAGAVFVLEELVGVFDMDVTIATIGATTGAIPLRGSSWDKTPISISRLSTFPVSVPSLPTLFWAFFLAFWGSFTIAQSSRPWPSAPNSQ